MYGFFDYSCRTTVSAVLAVILCATVCASEERQSSEVAMKDTPAEKGSPTDDRRVAWLKLMTESKSAARDSQSVVCIELAKAALKECDGLDQTDPRRSATLLHLATSYSNLKMWDLCEKAAQQYLESIVHLGKRYGGRARGLRLIGTARLMQERPEDAMQPFEEAMSIEEESGRQHLMARHQLSALLANCYISSKVRRYSQGAVLAEEQYRLMLKLLDINSRAFSKADQFGHRNQYVYALAIVGRFDDSERAATLQPQCLDTLINGCGVALSRTFPGTVLWNGALRCARKWQGKVSAESWQRVQRELDKQPVASQH